MDCSASEKHIGMLTEALSWQDTFTNSALAAFVTHWQYNYSHTEIQMECIMYFTEVKNKQTNKQKSSKLLTCIQ